MAVTNAKTFIGQGEFTALQGGLGNNIGVIETEFRSLVLSVAIANVRLYGGEEGVGGEWAGAPSTADIAAITQRAALIVGGGTTSEPIEREALAATNATVADAPVEVIDVTTPPRDKGTYTVLWSALVGMLATITNAGVRGTITLSLIRAGVTIATRTYTHGWNQQEPQLFGAGLTFTCQAGDRIRARLQVTKLGVPAATAQMGMARVTIDQIAAG